MPRLRDKWWYRQALAEQIANDVARWQLTDDIKARAEAADLPIAYFCGGELEMSDEN